MIPVELVCNDITVLVLGVIFLISVKYDGDFVIDIRVARRHDVVELNTVDVCQQAVVIQVYPVYACGRIYSIINLDLSCDISVYYVLTATIAVCKYVFSKIFYIW